MTTPSINHSYIEKLILNAEAKIVRFRQKIADIECAVVKLNNEREPIAAILEYIDLSDDRKKLLLDLFVYPNEYGVPEDISQCHIEYCRDVLSTIEWRIGFYEHCKERRLKGIQFIENDIALLKKMYQATFRHPILYHGLLDC